VSAADPGLRPRIAPRDDLRALEGYHSPQLDVAVRLNTNESPFPPPDAFVAEWLDELGALAFHRYPDRAAARLRAALGAHLGQPAERIFPANGSNEVLQTLLLTYGGPGRRALVFEPTYALHQHIARITATEVVAGERGARFEVPAAGLDEVVGRSGAALVLLCSPNNPTGTVEPEETIRAAVDAAERHGALVVVDEAYGEFAPRSALDLVADDRPLAVVRTYSKVWSMAALRLGFCVAPPWVVAELDKVVLPYSLDAPTQIAGVLALEHVAEMRDRVDRLVRERERVFGALDRLDGVTPVPSGANFVLLRVAGDAHAVWRRLVDRGVLVRDFSRWPGVEGCLRVTVGTPHENDAFLAALAAVLEEGSP
jgi:histidinol-phosphate aminotransferase